MNVAEILITTGGFSLTSSSHGVCFDNLDEAQKEFERIADIVKHRSDRANDIPKTIDIVGAGRKLSVPVDHIVSIALCDFAKENEHQAGVRDAFPNIFKR